MTDLVWNLILFGVPLIIWIAGYLFLRWQIVADGRGSSDTHAVAILLPAVVALIVFGMIGLGGLLYKATADFRYEVAPEFQEWMPVQTVELEALSTTTELSGGGGLSFISIGENDVISYLAKSDDGGVTLKHLDVNDNTTFYEIPADATAADSIPRIVWLECQVTDPNAPKRATCDYINFGQHVEIWVPDGSISRDISVTPR